MVSLRVLRVSLPIAAMCCLENTQGKGIKLSFSYIHICSGWRTTVFLTSAWNKTPMIIVDYSEVFSVIIDGRSG